MIDQQFIAYIRRQLSLGIAKEDIKKVLKINGLSEEEMAEGFGAVETVLSAPPAPAIPTVTPSAAPSAPLQPAIPVAQEPAPRKAASMWAKGIPRTNWTFMVISLLLVFGLDLFIAISSPDLRSYWYMMLAVFAVFAVFFCLENFVFRKRFANTASPLDKWISLIIVVRNLIFLLNFIPFIQLLGLALLGGFLAIIPGLFGGGGGFGIGGGIGLVTPILLVLYIILVISRYSATKNQ